jgi:2,3-dihydroxybenzoate decarboxylase
VKLVALEEAFSIPGLADPMPGLSSRVSAYAEEWRRKLPDFTEYRLPEMDDAGIDVQVLSLTVPGLQADIDADTARTNARQANDYLAEVVTAHPTRFRGFAALPLQDPDAAVAELHRCVTELGFCGALVNDYLGGHYLDEPRYEPIWEALESLGVPLYLHPWAPPADHWHVLSGHPELHGSMWSWAAEVSNEVSYRLQRAPSAYLGTNIVFTTSGVSSPAALLGAVLEVGADAIMFSVDYPYESSHEAVDGFYRTTLSPSDREKIAHGNAERILKV